MLEVRNQDGLARLGLFTIGKKTIKTPNIAVVVNPNELIIPPAEMKRDFGVDLIITNAYIIKHSKKAKEIEKVGLHKYLDFDGIIYTDSGTYQMFSKGGVMITNQETLNYQQKIGSEIHTPLDLFTLPTDEKKVASIKLKETIKRIKEIKSKYYSAPIQGGVFMDLRAKACKAVSKTSASVFPIGGIVPLMINYDFKRLIEIVLECKKYLPLNVPVHAFGAGHPLIFSLLAYAGVDLFDSASYALYARKGKYITENGTKDVKDLVSLPCDCPICTKYSVNELKKESLLARHNLHAIMREVRLVRQAIHEGRLFELVLSRAMSHPNIYYALKKLLEYQSLLRQEDPVRKRNALFITDELSLKRPEITYALSKVKGKVPKPLKMLYPFGQSLGWRVEYAKKCYSDLATLRLMADYQFGEGAGQLIPRDVKITKTRNQRLHSVYHNDELLFVIRASDGYFSLQKAGAKLFKNYLKKVYVQKDLAKFYQKGGDVFAKHVIKTKNVKSREEVLVLAGRQPVAIGEAVLSSKGMIDFTRGVAVDVREGL